MNKNGIYEREYIQNKKYCYWHAAVNIVPNNPCNRAHISNICDEHHCNSQCNPGATGATGLSGPSGATGAPGLPAALFPTSVNQI